ncbi:hypothetical protein HDU67_008260 [Dinochytrium kinnereticum]|nr:hypothetical protein HDU67_008260 [Dinochytrium kinnereticum]
MKTAKNESTSRPWEYAEIEEGFVQKHSSNDKNVFCSRYPLGGEGALREVALRRCPEWKHPSAFPDEVPKALRKHKNGNGTKKSFRDLDLSADTRLFLRRMIRLRDGANSENAATASVVIEREHSRTHNQPLEKEKGQNAVELKGYPIRSHFGWKFQRREAEVSVNVECVSTTTSPKDSKLQSTRPDEYGSDDDSVAVMSDAYLTADEGDM